MKVTILSNLIMKVAFLHVLLAIFIRSKWAEVQSMLKWKGLHRVWILRDRDVGASLATGYHTITLKHTLKDIHVFPRELVGRVIDGRQELDPQPSLSSCPIPCSQRQPSWTQGSSRDMPRSLPFHWRAQWILLYANWLFRQSSNVDALLTTVLEVGMKMLFLHKLFCP